MPAFPPGPHGMHTGRVVLAVALATLAAGCLGYANMTDLKKDLGAHEVPDPPEAAFDVSATEVDLGETVTFTATPSRDPLGAGLDHVWDLDDGTTARGRQVDHAYAEPGTYTVTLTVTDAQGRTDEAVRTVAVAQPNRPPEAAIAVESPSGDPVDAAAVGETVRFDARASSDPDGDALSYAWRLGDGSEAQGPDVGHAYDGPGVYRVTVTATDSRGAADEARVVLPVHLDRTWEDRVAAPNTTSTHPFPVEDGAALEVNLTFEAGPLGGNDLDLSLVDADGETVARSNATTPLGASGTQHEEIVLDPDEVRESALGAWTAQVERAAGGDVDYALRVLETFPGAE